MKNFQLHGEDIYRAVSPKTKMIFICNPNNPTGIIMPAGDLKKLMAALPPSVVVVMDEAYYEYVDHPGYPDSLAHLKRNENVVIFRTFSKIYGLAGLRLGYGMARPDYVNAMEKIREPFAANRVVQAGVLEALADQAHTQQVKDAHGRGKQVLCQGLSDLNINFIPTEANFLFADLGVDMELLFPTLLKNGVIIRPGTAWGYPTFARITIAIPMKTSFSWTSWLLY
ncbi:MAG: histidinol-phosphate transaminase [Candidatus Syntrophopropionicum ammoniitolerans]